MKILVTGANGFIGQHLVHSLEGHGIKVNAFDKNSSKLKIISKATIFEGDIFNNGKQILIGNNKKENLQIFNNNNEELWTGGEVYGGSYKYIEYK